MLFNSYSFLFGFLPVTLAILYLLVRYNLKRWAIGWLGIASVLFYSLWDVHYVPLLLTSIVVNYVAGAAILSSRQHKTLWLRLGLLFNLGALCYYKYTVFLLRDVAPFFIHGIGVPAIALPLGISFFTFTQIAFLVDCRRKERKRYPFFDYLAFVTFFPHLVAGPILQHKSFMPQLESPRFSKPRLIKIYWGIVFFSLGLFKKVIIADTLAPYVNTLFSSEANLTVIEGWNAAILYTFQLYYDFSGYSEMALGLGFLMNIRIPLNFNSPYKARSAIEFWRNWHMSLSRFLRDYVYIPLGGNRAGKTRHLINLFTTMVIGGVWHGAGWTYLFWGALHGSYLVINNLWRETKIAVPAAIGTALTFLAVASALVVFRSPSLTAAFHIIGSMLGLYGAESSRAILLTQLPLTLTAIGFMVWTVVLPNTRQLAVRRNPAWHVTILTILAFAISIAYVGKPSEFLYFQF